MAFKLGLNAVRMAHKWRQAQGGSLYGLGNQKSKARKLGIPKRGGGSSEGKESEKGSPNSVYSHL